MQKNDIFLSIRPKPKQANKSVIIKSAEGNVQRMFEGRKELLGLKTSGLEQITFVSPNKENGIQKKTDEAQGSTDGYDTDESNNSSVSVLILHILMDAFILQSEGSFVIKIDSTKP